MLQNPTRRCFSRAFSMRLNRLVNHGELNDTTGTRGWKGATGEKSFRFWRIIITQWFHVINSIPPRCFDIICHSDVAESAEIPTCCKWAIELRDSNIFSLVAYTRNKVILSSWIIRGRFLETGVNVRIPFANATEINRELEIKDTRGLWLAYNRIIKSIIKFIKK